MCEPHIRLGLTVFLFWAASLCAQDNVVINTPILESHFYRPTKQPLFVKYELYRGGGSCSRANMKFKNDRPELQTATTVDYEHSGYDIGHLANAEDFAGDCNKERMTFVFYNAVPQTHNLNAGIWKRVENSTRKWSQTDHLLVICGGTRFVKRNKLYVPRFCYKVVQSETTGAILFCAIFSNTTRAKETDLSEAALEKRLGYSLPIIRRNAQRWMRRLFVWYFGSTPERTLAR